MKKSRTEIIEYINSLKAYEGYVQFSDTPLRECDVFEGYQDIQLTPTKGFVYEAHFYNGENSIMIRQQNAEWIVSKTSIVDVEKKDIEFYALEKTKYLEKVTSNWVKMAQIWEPEKDDLCENMEVMKLKKVVFAGFEIEKLKGES